MADEPETIDDIVTIDDAVRILNESGNVKIDANGLRAIAAEADIMIEGDRIDLVQLAAFVVREYVKGTKRR